MESRSFDVNKKIRQEAKNDELVEEQRLPTSYKRA